MSQTIAKDVRVTGFVQGVFFRAWTQEKARALGVNGWVRNCSDGSVEARFEGPSDKVRWLIDLMRDGPSGSRVDHVHAREAAVEGLDGFDVRR